MTDQLRVAAVIRMSTDKQVNSPDRQRLLFHDYCAKWRINAVAEYTDEAMSASKTRYFERPRLAQMLQDAEKGAFELVWVEELSRMARDEADFFIMKKLLTAAGVAIVELQDDPRHAQDGLSQAIKAIIYANETRRLGIRISNAAQARVERGRWAAGRPPLGFFWDKEAGRFTINEQGAATVLRAFELYAELGTIAAALVALHAEGFTGSRGAPLGARQLMQTLEHPFHRGRMRWKDQEYPADIPRIVPEALLEAVSSRLADRRRRPQRTTVAKATYAGLLQCSQCGSTISPNSNLRAGEGYRRYRCCNYTPPLFKCKLTVTELRLEKLLLPRLLEELQHFAEVKPVVIHARRKVKGALNPDQVSERRRRIEEMYAECKIDKARLNELLAALEKDIAEAKARAVVAAEGPAISPEVLRGVIGHLSTDWQNLGSGERREVLQSVIHRIVVPEDWHDLPSAEVIWRQ